MRLDLEGTRRCKAICETMEAKVNVLTCWLAASRGFVSILNGTRGSALRDKIKWFTGLVSEISAFPIPTYVSSEPRLFSGYHTPRESVHAPPIY